jgi:hypothetical protein
MLGVSFRRERAENDLSGRPSLEPVGGSACSVVADRPGPLRSAPKPYCAPTNEGRLFYIREYEDRLGLCPERLRRFVVRVKFP